MRFKLEFDADNAAFEENGSAEIARILRDVASKVDNGAVEGAVRDINGNRVGLWAIAGTK